MIFVSTLNLVLPKVDLRGTDPKFICRIPIDNDDLKVWFGARGGDFYIRRQDFLYRARAVDVGFIGTETHPSSQSQGFKASRLYSYGRYARA